MATASDLKSENIRSVRTCFYTHGNLSVNQTEKLTGLSHGSVINVFRSLEESGEILLSEKTGSSVGRKTHRYILNPEYIHFLTIDVSRTPDGFASRTWRMNLRGEETDVRTRYFPVMDETYLHQEIDTMMEQYPDTDMILISTPGVCSDGVITNGETFRMDIGQFIDRKYHIPFAAENDVNVAAIGFHSEFPDSGNIAVIYQAEQGMFGCGVLIAGRLYNGFSHAAGELRYLPHMEERKKEPPAILLGEMIQSVAAILNPEIIGYASDPLRHEASFEGLLPGRHMPRLIYIEDLSTYRRKGLYSIGMYNMSQQSKGVKK
ncbi:MAG: ROK family protein [Solobacterium sp.]|nr:ROK family protein [Solobacterium sp.]